MKAARTSSTTPRSDFCDFCGWGRRHPSAGWRLDRRTASAARRHLAGLFGKFSGRNHTMLTDKKDWAKTHEFHPAQRQTRTKQDKWPSPSKLLKEIKKRGLCTSKYNTRYNTRLLPSESGGWKLRMWEGKRKVMCVCIMWLCVCFVAGIAGNL